MKNEEIEMSLVEDRINNVYLLSSIINRGLKELEINNIKVKISKPQISKKYKDKRYKFVFIKGN